MDGIAFLKMDFIKNKQKNNRDVRGYFYFIGTYSYHYIMPRIYFSLIASDRPPSSIELGILHLRGQGRHRNLMKFRPFVEAQELWLG